MLSQSRYAGTLDPTDMPATSENTSVRRLINSKKHHSKAWKICSRFSTNKIDFLRGSTDIFKTQHVIVRSNFGILIFFLAHLVDGTITLNAGLSPCNDVLMNSYVFPSHVSIEFINPAILPLVDDSVTDEFVNFIYRSS